MFAYYIMSILAYRKKIDKNLLK